MADEDEDVAAKLSRLEDKIDRLVARQAPMTPGRAAAEARQAMARGYAAAAAERGAATEDGGAE